MTPFSRFFGIVPGGNGGRGVAQFVGPMPELISMPRGFRLELRQSQFLPQAARAFHVLFGREGDGRVVPFLQRVDEQGRGAVRLGIVVMPTGLCG